MHYFLLCQEDLIEIFVEKLMLHVIPKIGLRIVLRLAPHKQKPTQLLDSFSLLGSFSLVSSNKHLQAKPTKEMSIIYQWKRSYVKFNGKVSIHQSPSSQKHLLEIPLVCWTMHFVGAPNVQVVKTRKSECRFPQGLCFELVLYNF